MPPPIVTEALKQVAYSSNPFVHQYTRNFVSNDTRYFTKYIVMSMSLCLSVHSHNSETSRRNFIKFLCILPVAIVRSFSDTVALLSTSGFVDWPSKWPDRRQGKVGPIPWGHSGPHCHALSLLSLMLLWTSMHRRRATVATPGEWQCKTGGVRLLAVANGPNIFQMLLVLVV